MYLLCERYFPLGSKAVFVFCFFCADENVLFFNFCFQFTKKFSKTEARSVLLFNVKHFKYQCIIWMIFVIIFQINWIFLLKISWINLFIWTTIDSWMTPLEIWLLDMYKSWVCSFPRKNMLLSVYNCIWSLLSFLE